MEGAQCSWSWWGTGLFVQWSICLSSLTLCPESAWRGRDICLQRKTQCCVVWKPWSADLSCCLRGITALGLESGTRWRVLWVLSGAQTIMLHCFSTWVPMKLPGETRTHQMWLQGTGGECEGLGGSGDFIFEPWERLEKK